MLAVIVEIVKRNFWISVFGELKVPLCGITFASICLCFLNIKSRVTLVKRPLWSDTFGFQFLGELKDPCVE